MENRITHAWQSIRCLCRYLRHLISASIVLVLTYAAVADEAASAAAQLQLKPQRCVALHQGQMCYQSVQLFWRAPQAGHYCLYQQSAETPIHCWQNVAAGQFQYEFASDTSLDLQLVNVQDNKILATATLEVAWVYKANTRRKTHWRLF